MTAFTRFSTICCRSTWPRARHTSWWRSAAPAAGTGQWRSRTIWRSRYQPLLRSTWFRSFTGTSNAPDVIDHVGFEVSDLTRSAGFYDPVFFALGGRRMLEVRARRRLRGQRGRILDRRPRTRARTGLRPPRAAGERQGGGRCRLQGWARQRRQRRWRLRACVRNTAGATTRRTCAIPTACGWKSSRADDSLAFGLAGARRRFL